ncbi:DUF3024 domain-containing protein [Syntrophotalea carbinolica]|uniref:DUF3024 domain-containing protein n=1 Tax=Syntrophotalea carbinolica TaxID=19 RepID=UPI00005CA06A|nr:DUF3024 domain-containing protein [Syntrophotalea carbinolica]
MVELSEFEVKRIEKLFGDFCDKRVPGHWRDKIRVEFRVRGDSVELFESRPLHNDPDSWISTRIARFKKSARNGLWNLYCAGRDAQWQRYAASTPQRDIEALLRIVEQDTIGAFWG